MRGLYFCNCTWITLATHHTETGPEVHVRMDASECAVVGVVCDACVPFLLLLLLLLPWPFSAPGQPRADTTRPDTQRSYLPCKHRV